ncbi:MAG TPA: hypothetical protein VFH33_02035, partial [Candidatus Krumholzibacteria bacterium]|nr:hypothetical protein [Candidatus Krumholzibacteria bacterium]
MSATNQTAFPRVRAAIRDVADFPKAGILFKDITPILSDAKVFAEVIGALTERYRGMRIDKIAGVRIDQVADQSNTAGLRDLTVPRLGSGISNRGPSPKSRSF